MSWRRVKAPRKEPMTTPIDHEVKKIRAQHEFIAGIDEAGWGPIAGPLVAACVILPKNIEIPKFIKDSKKLNEARRVEAYTWIYQNAVYISVAVASVDMFTKNGASFARDYVFNTLAKDLAFETTTLSSAPFIVVDGDYLPEGMANAAAVVKADVICPEVSAASIIAKVNRDNAMVVLSSMYPEFNWDLNKGYATPEHLSALKKFGATKMHRGNVKKVKEAKPYGNEAPGKD